MLSLWSSSLWIFQQDNAGALLEECTFFAAFRIVSVSCWKCLAHHWKSLWQHKETPAELTSRAITQYSSSLGCRTKQRLQIVWLVNCAYRDSSSDMWTNPRSVWRLWHLEKKMTLWTLSWREKTPSLSYMLDDRWKLLLKRLWLIGVTWGGNKASTLKTLGQWTCFLLRSDLQHRADVTPGTWRCRPSGHFVSVCLKVLCSTSSVITAVNSSAIIVTKSLHVAVWDKMLVKLNCSRGSCTEQLHTVDGDVCSIWAPKQKEKKKRTVEVCFYLDMFRWWTSSSSVDSLDVTVMCPYRLFLLRHEHQRWLQKP